jgi:4-aminobutyrate aminotransferase-like enzyme/Ser/Thr protein kinase RdoA (MazF antagonist)
MRRSRDRLVPLAQLIALDASPLPIGPREAERLAHEMYGIVGSATPLSGERDRNFRLSSVDNDYVLKVIDPSADDSTADCQTLVLTHLAEQAPDLPVPRIIAALDKSLLSHGQVEGVAYRLRVIEFMPGELMLDVARDPALLEIVGGTLGRLDRALRGFFHPALGQPIVWDVRRAPALLPYLDYVASPAIRRLVRDALEAVAAQGPALRTLRAQAIHGDFHPCNILISKARDACSAILDFGDMIHAPLVLDLAVTMAEFLIQGAASTEHISRVITGFASQVPLESDEIEKLFDLVTARVATAILVYAWRRHRNPAGAEATADSFAVAEGSLVELARIGRQSLTRHWHEAAGTASQRAVSSDSGPRLDVPPLQNALLSRRRRLLGAHAELAYDTPIDLVRGSGVWVFSADGRRFLDVYNNVPHVGHANPLVVDAVRVQASRIASNTRYLDKVILDYAERLTRSLPGELNACLFVNSGSEANDIAWQIARLRTGNAGAIVTEHAYHGITEALISLSPEISSTKAAHVEWLTPPSGDRGSAITSADQLNALAARDVERAIDALKKRGMGLAALMLDSALTSDGIYDPPAAWMEPIAAAVHAAGGLMIADEVQYGLGRCGTHLWGFSRRGYSPDIVTLGKPIGNGFPLGVVITRRDILEEFQKRARRFSTFGGNPVAAAAGLAVFEILEREQLMAKANETGRYFRERLIGIGRSIAALGEVRGSGLMIGVDVLEPDGAPAPRRARLIVNGLRDRGVLIGTTGPRGHVLKLRPPMVFERAHVDLTCETLLDLLTGGAF